MAGIDGRRQEIVRLIAQLGGFATVAVLSRELAVSAITVRRDLQELEQAGEITRMHGGARLVERHMLIFEPPFLARQADNHEAKRLIASSAAKLIAPGATIGIDTGTSTLALCDHLPKITGLSVVTTSLAVSSRLADAVDVYIPGGKVRAGELSVVGHDTCESLSKFHLDLLFLGVAGITPRGTSDYSVEDAETKRTMIQNSTQVILLCDSSKFSMQGMAAVAPLDSFDFLITNENPPDALHDALKGAGVKIVIVQ